MPELNVLVQRLVVTDDRESAAAEIVAAVPTLDLADALETPFLLLGTHDEIAAQIVDARRRWGISYFTVRVARDVRARDRTPRGRGRRMTCDRACRIASTA